MNGVSASKQQMIETAENACKDHIRTNGIDCDQDCSFCPANIIGFRCDTQDLTNWLTENKEETMENKIARGTVAGKIRDVYKAYSAIATDERHAMAEVEALLEVYELEKYGILKDDNEESTDEHGILILDPKMCKRMLVWDFMTSKTDRIVIAKFNGKYLAVDFNYEAHFDRQEGFKVRLWDNAIPIPTTPTLTHAEIEEKLGMSFVYGGGDEN